MPDSVKSGRNGHASDWRVYLRLLQYARPYRARLALGILFGILFGGSTLGLLVSFQGGLSQVFGGSDVALVDAIEERAAILVDPEQTPLVVTLLLLALLPCFTLLRGIGFFLSKYFVEWVGHRVVMDVRNEVFGHIQDLPLLFLTHRRTGELMSRTTSDTQLVEHGVSTVLGDLAREPFVLAGAIAMLIRIDPNLAVVSLVLFPACIIPVAIFGRMVRRSAREGQEKLGDLSSIQQETLVGNRIVKAFGTEEEEKRRFRQSSHSVFRRHVGVTRARAALAPVIELISVIIGCVLLLYARWASLNWDELLLFLGTLVVMYDPVKKLSRLHLGVQQASAAADRIFEILDEEVAVLESPRAQSWSETLHTIGFENVSFDYGRGPVLRNVRLKVGAGECVALVGSSGGGKTTLVSLLPRFYDVVAGSIRFNDTDIRDLTLRSLRRQIGIVTQDTILFNRTVAENIAYGTPEADRAMIEEASRRAHAHDFVQELEHGYDTMIGEQGALLSGGQRQRLSIARAMVRNPPILILDEATSALDSESERHVQAALDALMAGRTVFAIAHRLSTIQHADRIIVLEQGQIVEEGSHAGLLARGGKYKYFFDLQFAPSARNPGVDKSPVPEIQ